MRNTAGQMGVTGLSEEEELAIDILWSCGIKAIGLKDMVLGGVVTFVTTLLVAQPKRSNLARRRVRVPKNMKSSGIDPGGSIGTSRSSPICHIRFFDPENLAIPWKNSLKYWDYSYGLLSPIWFECRKNY